MLSLDMCTHGNTCREPAIEAVREEHNHDPKEKVQATGAEGSADQRQNVSRTSFNNLGHVTGL